FDVPEGVQRHRRVEPGDCYSRADLLEQVLNKLPARSNLLGRPERRRHNRHRDSYRTRTVGEIEVRLARRTRQRLLDEQNAVVPRSPAQQVLRPLPYEAPAQM